jgi:hypothetical protein
MLLNCWAASIPSLGGKQPLKCSCRGAALKPEASLIGFPRTCHAKVGHARCRQALPHSAEIPISNRRRF